MPRFLFAVVGIVLTLLLQGITQADLILGIHELASLNGDGAGDFFDYADSETSELFRLTTDSLSPDGTVRATTASGTGGLGVNGSSDLQSLYFEGNEAWQFHWDKPTVLTSISFAGFASVQRFYFQSNDFIGLNVVPAAANVSFNSGTGEFEFAPGTSTIFDASDLNSTGTSSLMISANSSITIGYHANGLNAATNQRLTGMSFSTAVPEPDQLLLLCCVVPAACYLRRRRHTKRLQCEPGQSGRVA